MPLFTFLLLFRPTQFALQPTSDPTHIHTILSSVSARLAKPTRSVWRRLAASGAAAAAVAVAGPRQRTNTPSSIIASASSMSSPPSSASPGSLPRVTPAELRSTLLAAERKVVVVDVRDEVRSIQGDREGERTRSSKLAKRVGHTRSPDPGDSSDPPLQARKKNPKRDSPSAPTRSRTRSTPQPPSSAPRAPRARRRSTRSCGGRSWRGRPRSSCTARCRRCAARPAPRRSPTEPRSSSGDRETRPSRRSGSRCSTGGLTRGTTRSALETSSPRSSPGSELK